MDAPTLAELRNWSQLDFEELGFGAGPEELPARAALAVDTPVPGTEYELKSVEGFAASGEAIIIDGGRWITFKYTGISGTTLQGCKATNVSLVQVPIEGPWMTFDAGTQVQQYEADKLLQKWKTSLSELAFVTGQDFAKISEPDLGNRLAEALRMILEYKVVAFSQDNIETAGDFDMIQNFSAGSYSETRRQDNRRSLVLHPWPNLNRLLWGLITPAKLAEMGMDDVPGVSEIEDPARWDVAANILRVPYPASQFPFPNQYGGWN